MSAIGATTNVDRRRGLNGSLAETPCIDTDQGKLLCPLVSKSKQKACIDYPVPIILRVGRTVVYALAKQLNKEWDQKALETASSPESLSMAADDFADALQNVRGDIGRKLRISRLVGEVSATEASLVVG